MQVRGEDRQRLLRIQAHTHSEAQKEEERAHIESVALAAHEARRAPLGHRLHTFPEILGAAQPRLLRELVLGRLAHALGEPRSEEHTSELQSHSFISYA